MLVDLKRIGAASMVVANVFRRCVVVLGDARTSVSLSPSATNYLINTSCTCSGVFYLFAYI